MLKSLLILPIATLCLASPASGQSASVDGHLTELEARVEHYGTRYPLEDLDEKLTGNHGEGFEALYGTRNFRVVLKGVVYRGGANNKWNRDGKRANRNPLPDVGLDSLCREGFGSAYYLYTTNYEDAPHETTCETPSGARHILRYLKVDPGDESETYLVLEAVRDAIEGTGSAPIYIHCWNGWHASGLLAATILRQFCGLSADEAVAYWDRNTDGHDRRRRHEKIRRQIRRFTPYPEFAITKSKAALVCP